MKTFFSVSLIVLSVTLVSSVGYARQPSASQPAPGLNTSADDDQDEAEIQDNLARLKPADRELAEAQRFCPVLKRRLGEMGPPIKMVIKGQPVFVCCKGCARKAQANPEKTLAIVAAMLRANRER
jgi:hypothetical protein